MMSLLLFILIVFVICDLFTIKNALAIILENQETMFSIMHRVDDNTEKD